MEARTKWTDERLDDREKTVDGRLDRLEANMDRRFDAVDGRLSELDQRVDSLTRMILGGTITVIATIFLKGLLGG